MNRKLLILLLCCMAMLVPSIASAQELSIFAKQKVVIANIIDRNDRPLSPEIKKLIHQGFTNALVNSSDFEVYDTNVEDIKRQLRASGKEPNFANICNVIGRNADYIIFTNIKSSSSALGSQSQNVTIFISTTMYRINTASEVLSDQDRAEPNEQSILSISSQLISRMLGIKATASASTQESNSVSQISTSQQSSASAEELNDKGDELYNNKQYTEAVSYYRLAAEQGNASAQCSLGDCYYYGEGVAENHYEAVKWYRKAAEQGDDYAQFCLGDCYYDGEGVTQNYYEAVKWYRKAAEQGDDYAQFCLGICYYYGEGVAENYYEAVRWYRKAAEQGNKGAQNSLGDCYYDGEGVTQNYYEAVKWYRKAAEQGQVGAQYNLGECYEKGLGVTQNYYEAVKWYRKAAEQGHSPSKEALIRLNQ